MTFKPFHRLVIYFCIVAGILLRFIWLDDMEWKWDEQWMWLHSSDWAKNKIWPDLGVMSGGGIVNTGVSTWPFIIFRYLNLSPVGMVWAVAIMNVVGIGIFYLSLIQWNPKWKHLILPGIAIASTHLLHIIFSRKIWAQDLLPFFTSIAFWGFVNRKSWIGIFAWALGLGLAMQVHMSGFYLAASMILTAIWYDGGVKTSFTWVWKLSMFLVWALLPSLNWAFHVISHAGKSSTSILNIFKFEFFIRFISDVVGINIVYSLGKTTPEFLKAPYSYLNLIFLLILCGIFLFVVYKLFKVKTLRTTIWNDKESKFLLWAYIILPAFFFTISGINVRDHYLIVLFPMIQILFTIVVNEINPKFISWILVCQFWVSSNFLMFVHNNPNIKGDYGVPFSEQAKLGNPIPEKIDE